MCIQIHYRVLFSVSSSPFLLNATVKYHLERFLGTNEAIVKRLLQSTYVDDWPKRSSVKEVLTSENSAKPCKQGLMLRKSHSGRQTQPQL